MQNIEPDRPDKVFNKVYLEIKSGERLPITIGSIVTGKQIGRAHV